ncbi:hypothetical protein Baya_12512 [Bagarius yarrelli]|uniref:Uncharacterized protein n=1 Tax=Bagarius yarrelli TaxID=175774 RepID=A0A556V3S8_BAGYA|nr:hypothetical protein Baya_12512 [Bagarius yarrelli]
MDVRFYPSSGGTSIPGDPQNMDFSHCSGYYSYNKVEALRKPELSAPSHRNAADVFPCNAELEKQVKGSSLMKTDVWRGSVLVLVLKMLLRNWCVF